MFKSESNNMRLIQLALGKHKNITMFRNNTGTGWVGEVVNKFMKGGDSFITMKNPRPLNAGLCKGSSDLIGWKSITITKEMIGKKVAIFSALEVKSQKGKATHEQLNFINVVKENGGISGIVKDENDAENLFLDGTTDFIFEL